MKRLSKAAAAPKAISARKKGKEGVLKGKETSKNVSAVDETCCPKKLKEKCSCGMLTLYRFVEPLALYMLKKNGQAYGYVLLNQLQGHILTDSPVDGPSLYRTLRILEKNGNLTSVWDTSHAGPARRLYSLTAKGKRHLIEWQEVLSRLSLSLKRFVGDIHELVTHKI